VPPAELQQRIAAATAVLLPSLWFETFGLTAIEAFAAARPVVATEVGAVRDLVVPGRTGWLAPRGDVAGLAEGILRQLEDRGAAELMGRRGRALVYPHLSIDRLEQDVRQLYRELAELKGLCGSVRPGNAWTFPAETQACDS